MAAKTTTKPAKVTEADIDAEIERRVAERLRADAEAKRQARTAFSGPGLHVLPLTEADRQANRLARVRLNKPGKPVLWGEAVMVADDAGKTGCYVSIRPGRAWRPFGLLVTEAGQASAALAYVAEAGPGIEAALLKAYRAEAKRHTFRPKAAKAEQAEATEE